MLKTTHITLLAAGLLLAMLTALYAAEKKKEAEPDPLTEGTGKITADGAGMAQVSMLEGTATVSGSGVFWVTENAVIKIQSEKPVVWQEQQIGTQRVKLCTNFYGDAVLTGEKYAFSLRGTGITLTAQGIGRAGLTGEGKYTTRNAGQKKEKSGKWWDKPKAGAKAKNVEFGTWEREGKK